DPKPRDFEARFGKEQDALNVGIGGLTEAQGVLLRLHNQFTQVNCRDVKAKLNLETGHWTVKGFFLLCNDPDGHCPRIGPPYNQRAIEWEADVSYTPIGRLPLWEWHTVRMDYHVRRSRDHLSAAACL